MQCTVNLKTQKQQNLHFDTECSVTTTNLIFVIPRYHVLVGRAMGFCQFVYVFAILYRLSCAKPFLLGKKTQPCLLLSWIA